MSIPIGAPLPDEVDLISPEENLSSENSKASPHGNKMASLLTTIVSSTELYIALQIILVIVCVLVVRLSAINLAAESSYHNVDTAGGTSSR